MFVKSIKDDGLQNTRVCGGLGQIRTFCTVGGNTLLLEIYISQTDGQKFVDT